METFRDFDLLNTPLEGANLIEASAGTGKSFSIAGLFLRLVVEKRLAVNEILVVTFTQAATEELKDRIRKRLRDALEAYRRGCSEEPFLDALVRRGNSAGVAVDLLREALRNFDQAAVMTIHGFCRRMLQEHTFESGNPYDAELLSHQDLIKQEVVEDFWRKHLYGAPPLFVRYALQAGFIPDALLKLLGNWHSHPHLKILPATTALDAAPEEAAFLESWNAVRVSWPSARNEVASILTSSDALKRNIYGSDKIPLWIEAMSALISSPFPSPHLFGGFEKFTRTELGRALKKGHRVPEHPFFDMCECLLERREALLNRYEEKLLVLRKELFGYVGAEFRERKSRKNVQHFDDLLLNLLGALEGRRGEDLSRLIRSRFRAALVDEFQDTDPLQYAIFKNIFTGEEGSLFLIGDPKQAIYGFRGADIFAYMEAARNVKTRFTLRENWRSERGLIEAVNALFTGRPRPFVFEGIPYHPSRPAPGKGEQMLAIDGKHEPPFRLWILEGEARGAGKAMTKAEARKVISRAVSWEISRLLCMGRAGRVRIGGEPLKEQDIAVLVRRNEEALQVQQDLSALRIPSVLYSTGNLFGTHEAVEMERVLGAVAVPEDARAVRAALVTDILGLTAEALEKVMQEEDIWEEWIVRLRNYQGVWEDRGFMRMFRQLLSQERVISRLMVFSDGERRNTNLLHLGEILHQVSLERRLDGPGLLKWLAEQVAGGGTVQEEHPIRLESDERAVKLVTIHKSKGLEYPVVFCPFAWDGSGLRRSTDPFVFHEGESPDGLTLDLGSAKREENRKRAEKEMLSENLRLLYVGLTRAKARCTLVWGRFNEAETSAPAYLLYPPVSDEEGDVLQATREKVARLGTGFASTLKEMAESSGGVMAVEDLPLGRGVEDIPIPPEEEVLTCKQFSGRIDRDGRVNSFSSLLSQRRHAEERGDHDDAEPPDALKTVEEEPQGIFSFPAGARAGTFLHDIFEHLDFVGETLEAVKTLVRDKLALHGFDLNWLDTLCAMIEKVVSAPLEIQTPVFCLKDVGKGERLNELEFTFPLKRISPKSLAGVFRDHGQAEVPSEFPERLERLEFSPVKGFMRGFMDLVFRFRGRFYLVDWKSNYLGPRVEDYDLNGLTRAMQQGHYILQYHIYTLALHRYLKLRLPHYRYEEHFGGLYYIFLRGVEPEWGPDFGIFRARPSPGFIRDLEAGLMG